MTYVVAAKHHGEVAIIADFGTSSRDRPGESPQRSAVKTGMLFDGCIYGIAGNAADARAFLVDFKTGLPKTWTISKCWAEFKQRAEKPIGDFKLLLACTHNGAEPQIYTYDASSATLTPMDDLASIGAGKRTLDEPVHRFRASLLPQWMNQLQEKNALDKWPYLYGMWLNQYAMSKDYGLVTAMERDGVTGLFHAISTTSTQYRAQGRSVFCGFNFHNATSTVDYGLHHITRRKDFIVMREIKNEHGHLYCAGDTHDEPGLRMQVDRITDIDRSRFTDDGADFYGFGFSDPQLFSKAFFEVPEPDDLPMSWDQGWIHERVYQRLREATGRNIGALPPQPVQAVGSPGSACTASMTSSGASCRPPDATKARR